MSADFLPLEVGNRWVYDVFNEAGHHPYREHPEQFNEMMLGFLRTIQ